MEKKKKRSHFKVTELESMISYGRRKAYDKSNTSTKNIISPENPKNPERYSPQFIDHFDKFWQQKTSWKTRKVIALSILDEKKYDESTNFFSLAYEGQHKKILKWHKENNKLSNKKVRIDLLNLRIDSYVSMSKQSIKEINENQSVENFSSEDFIFEKNSLGLTPLIYAIWGEEDRNDIQKTTSKLLLIFLQEKTKNNTIIFKILSHGHYIFFDNYIKKELGHILLHELFELNRPKDNYLSQSDLIEFIKNDLYESISYTLEVLGFESVYLNMIQEESIVYTAIKYKAVNCLNLFFDLLLSKNNNYLDSNKMLLIIQNEISQYIKFNSPAMVKLLSNLGNIQETSKRVKIYFISQFTMVELSNQPIESLALNYIEDIDFDYDLINLKIFNTKIRLPALSGSKESLSLIYQITITENTSILKTDILKYYLQYKWDNLWPLIFFTSMLMWANIPLIVFLVFIDAYDKSLLIGFTIINFIFLVFEIFQFTSIGMSHYFGAVNLLHAWLGLRFILLGLIFIPNFQPFSCSLYFLISILMIFYEQSVADILKTILIFSVFVLALFLAFWHGWEYTYYLMIGFGFFTLIFCCGLSLKFIDFRYFGNYVARFLALGLLIEVIFNLRVDLGILVITQFLLGTVFFTQTLLIIRPAECLNLVFDFSLAVVFSVNFYKTDLASLFIVNLLVLIFFCISLLIKLRNYFGNPSSKINMFPFSICSTVMIGFDLKDSIEMKVFVIIFDFILILFYSYKKIISAKNVLRNTFSMIFCFNTIDLSQIIISGIWLSYRFNSTNNQALTYALVSLILIRGLTGFRCFRVTRYYIRLILNSIKDVLPFILIFFYSTLSFGIICSVYKDVSVSEIWIYPYDLNMGAGSHSDSFDINYLSFLIATIINVVIMLNLLISILGDSFDRFQVSVEEIDLMEMAKTLLEFETILFWRRWKIDKGKYLIGMLEDRKKNKLQGKVTKEEFNRMNEMVIDLRYSMDKRFEDCQKKISRIEALIIDSESRIVEAIKSHR